jgi:hypothetical protein
LARGGRLIFESVRLAHPIAAEASILPPVAMVNVRALTADEETELAGQNYAVQLFRETGLSAAQQRALHPRDLRAIIEALGRVRRLSKEYA